MGTRSLGELGAGDNVLVQKTPGSTWTPAKVVERLDRPRSYGLETTDGKRLERNRRHIQSREGDEEKTEEAEAQGGYRTRYRSRKENEEKTDGAEAQGEYRTRYGRLSRKRFP